jgi:hypothetical protein
METGLSETREDSERVQEEQVSGKSKVKSLALPVQRNPCEQASTAERRGKEHPQRDVREGKG